MADEQLNRIDEENEEELEGSTETPIENNGDNAAELENNNDNGNATENNVVVEARPRRECCICFSYIEDYQRYIQPCPCDSVVHYQCLLTGILRYEASHPGCGQLGCRTCLTVYKITPKDTTFRILDNASSRYRKLCAIGCHIIPMVLLDSTFAAYGFVILSKMYGQQEAESMIVSMNPVVAVAICKAIPLFSVATYAIPWEAEFLRFLRRCSRLPVVGRLFPSADPRVREPRYRRTVFGVIMGGLLLPWNANLLGSMLFGAVECRFCRLFLGGVTFLAVKGALKMFYRQRLYSRQNFLTVEPFCGD